MWRAVQIAAATILLTTATAANADVIQTFNVSGNAIESGPYFGGTIDIPADGTLIVDYTSGTVESVTLMPPESFVALLFWHVGLTLNSPNPPVSLGPAFSVPLLNNGEGAAFPVTFTLSDQIDGFYTDGTVAGSTFYSNLSVNECLSFNPACDPDNVIGYSGTLTSASITPIPATLPLLAAGLGGIGLLGWRRKRRAQAAAG
jgi:hypothetical protein